MLRCLDNLDRRIGTYLRRIIYRQWNLGQAKGPIVRLVGWPNDGKDRLHDQRIVFRHRAIAEIDVEQSIDMTLEPARLNTDSAACYGPSGSIPRHGHATTWRAVSVKQITKVEDTGAYMDRSIACHRDMYHRCQRRGRWIRLCRSH